MSVAVTVLVAFALALPVGTLVEYVLHRWVLHARRRTFVARRHRLHHKSNAADTLWGDFRDFSVGAVPVCWLGFLHSPAAGVGFLLGCVVYVFLLALVHKLSHERPGLVFWMPRNSHHMHHGETPRHNFGIVTRFWDRVFGTYADRGPGDRRPNRARSPREKRRRSQPILVPVTSSEVGVGTKRVTRSTPGRSE